MNGQLYGRFVAVVLAALIAGASVAAERVYKWVDKDGVVHYGQQPPPEAQAEAIKVQEGYSTKDEDEPKQPTEADKKAAAEAAYCKTATQNYEALNSEQEVKRKDDYGNIHVLTEEERVAERARAKGAMDQYCKPGEPAKKP